MITLTGVKSALNLAYSGLRITGTRTQNMHLKSYFYGVRFKLKKSIQCKCDYKQKHLKFGQNSVTNSFCTTLSHSKYQCLTRNRLFNFSIQKRTFHSTSPNSALPPALLLLLRPVSKLLAILFGRSIRVWWSKLPKHKKYYIIDMLVKYRYHLLGIFPPIGAVVVWFYVSHLEYEPLTQRRRFIAFSEEQVKAVALVQQEVVLEEYQNNVLPKTHPIYKQVAALAMHILRSNKELEKVKHTKWSVVVIDSIESRNAFVLPTGTIFMFTGMLACCDNLDQVGIILSHEIAHVLLSHVAEEMSRMHFHEFLLLIPIVIVWALFPDGAAILSHLLTTMFFNALVHLPFSRKLESEADLLGLTLAAKSCLDIREAVVFWDKMKLMSKNETEDLAEFLSTHPAYETRKNVLNSHIPEALKVRESSNCPRLPPVDPRDLFKSTDLYNKEGHYIIRI